MVQMDNTDLERVQRDEGRHYKLPNGDEYVSVTTVTSRHPQKQSAIERWEDRVGQETAKKIKNEAALLGTLVHHRILREYSLQRLPKPSIDLSNAYDGLETDIEVCESMWWDGLDFPVEDSPYVERKVLSHAFGYAGTFDMLTDGTVVDLKTSGAVRDSHRLQIAAYYNAIEELSDLPDPEDAAIIRLDPDPETNPTLEPHIEWLDEEQINYHFGTFKELL